MGEAVIYHGTPLTPRAALTSICTGRAMCVSFFRPDDVEVVEAISPDVMFRQWGILVLAGGAPSRRGLERDRRLASVFRLARAAPFQAWKVGDHAGHPRRAFPAQRQHPFRLAVRAEGISGLAYGWADRAALAVVRSAYPGLSWLDWTEGRIARLSRQNGRGRKGARQPLAGSPHAPRYGRGLRLPIRLGGQHLSSPEWMAI